MIPELSWLHGAATGQIQWHVIPEPRITSQCAATWWIHCHDSRAKCHIAGCSYLAKSMSCSCHIARCKNSIRHIKNRFSPYFIFCFFLMQFGLWRATAFVSSPIHLLITEQRELLQLCRPLRSLRSSNHNLLNIPRPHTAFVQRSFAHTAPRVWHSLHHTITDDIKHLCTSFQIQTKSIPLQKVLITHCFWLLVG